MNAQTLLELSDIRDRQSQMACIGCHDETLGFWGTNDQDTIDCFWSPWQCVKAAFGDDEAYKKMKMPDKPEAESKVYREMQEMMGDTAKAFPAPTQKTIRPLPPKLQVVRPYIGPECPPQLKSGCQAPGKFDPMTCTCEVPQPPARVTVPEGCQPPSIYDPVSKMCYQTAGVASEPWYKQPPVLIALGLGVVALALSIRK